jgi:hypothetical protein
MITVRKYESTDKELWNNFLENSKTNQFLLSRNFMEYHKDRFEDYSLLVFDEKTLVAIFPANIKNNVVVSHSGLTFGGFIVARAEATKNSIQYFAKLLKFASEHNIDKIIFKQSPSFYSSVSQDEVDYAMFLVDAKMYRVDIAYAINQQLENKIQYQERRRRAIKKAEKNGVNIIETTDFSTFWNEILTPNLQSRFGVNPVHSLAEIQSLSINNPNKIRQFEAWQNGVLLAGTTVFETPSVAHSQYISASDEGRKNGAIDLLFHHLISSTFAHKEIFDFGIVNEEEGRKINMGLLDWKEGFGARAYAHRFYEIETRNYVQIEKIFVTELNNN